MAPFAFYFCKLSRGTKVSVQLVADTCLIVFSFIGEMLFRLEDITFLSELRVWAAILATAAVTLACFQFLGLYHSIVRSLTSQILLVIGKGALVASITLYAMGLVFEANLPRSVPPIFGVFIFLTVSGLRFGAQSVFRKRDHLRRQSVLIYGAGEYGLQLLKALTDSKEYEPVAFVDEDCKLQGLKVGGLTVYPPDEIQKLI